MKLGKIQSHHTEAVVSLFKETFQCSEGASEGKLIAHLVQELIDTTAVPDLIGFCAADGAELLGSIFFSRITHQSDISVFMLSPVAVSTAHQKKGVGQALISYGLSEVKSMGVEVVVTYGDPDYYHKVGFHIILENEISPPYPLSHPEGWQGQSLISESLPSIPGNTQCVEAFRNKAYW